MIVHKELSQVVELSWFQSCFVRHTSLVHDLELVLTDIAIEVIIDLPNVKSNLSSQQFQTKEGKHLHEIGWTNLVLVFLRFLWVLADKVPEYFVKAFLLNGRNLPRLEPVAPSG